VNDMLTINEAAEVANCHPATIRRMIARGELPALKLGSRYRVRMDDLTPTVVNVPAASAQPRRKAGSFARLADEIVREGGRSARG